MRIAAIAAIAVLAGAFLTVAPTASAQCESQQIVPGMGARVCPQPAAPANNCDWAKNDSLVSAWVLAKCMAGARPQTRGQYDHDVCVEGGGGNTCDYIGEP